MVSDNDADPTASFREVQEELRKAKGFPVPEAERLVARARNLPAIVVTMLPMGKPGPTWTPHFTK